MTRLTALLIRTKARRQTQSLMRLYRARVFWGTDLWVAR